METKLNPNGNILIFTPTLGLNPDPNRYQASLLRVINQIQALQMGLSYFPAYRQTWWPANNMAWDLAFRYGFEYILRIDDDIWNIPDNAVSELVKADKDVIGAAYPNRRWPYFPAAMNRTKDKSLIEICMTNDMCLQYVQGLEEGKIVKCDIVGFGMTLIKTEKFEEMPRPIYLGNEEVPDDTYFAQLCIDNGIEQYVHFGVKVDHDFVNFMNNGYLYSAGVHERLLLQKAEEERTGKPMEEDAKKLSEALQTPVMVSAVEPA